MDFYAILKSSAGRINAPINYTGTGSPTFVDELMREIKTELVNYLYEVYPVRQLYNACFAKIQNPVCYIDENDPSKMFLNMYTNGVLDEISRTTKYTICDGCSFTDDFGFKGHPSQRRHSCLMNDEWENLNQCYGLAHDVVALPVIDDFLVILKHRPDIYLCF